MLEKIFNRPKKKDEPPAPLTRPAFGRYSDNNKPISKVEKWNEAEALYKEKKWSDSVAAFFSYLRDEEEENIEVTREGDTIRFLLYQGSKIIRGFYTAELLKAECVLARMPQPSVPVMRRLLEMNFNLYYSRYALRADALYMFFDSDIETANPSKLYYGLKELATKADKLDDLLVQDFATLLPADTAHIVDIAESEKAIKLQFFKQWISDTLALIAAMDNDKYAGGIAYLLLALAYRIDYFILPQGKLLLELEKIVEIYFRKDSRAITDKNNEMMECFQKLGTKDKEEFYPYLFRSRYTFSIVTPQNYKAISDAIYNANQNIAWYRENKLPAIAARISEYGFAYCQYSYSVPRPVAELFGVFMQINYPEFYTALLHATPLYNPETKAYDKEKIEEEIAAIINRWKEKYPDLNVDVSKLNYDNEVSFNQSFTTEVESLNLEIK